MSEWITTGQMIDKIQIGEVAETPEGFKAKKQNNGSIVWIHDTTSEFAYVSMNIATPDLQWRIIPQKSTDIKKIIIASLGYNVEELSADGKVVDVSYGEETNIYAYILYNDGSVKDIEKVFPFEIQSREIATKLIMEWLNE